MSRIAYVNGRYRPHLDALIHVEDRGYQFADGVYEVCEVRGARIVEDVHLEGRMGKFVVESDEPLARGGTEKGPSPLQYVMMGTAF